MGLELFLFFTVVIAAFVQSTTGFGYAIVLMALWPLFLQVPDATQLMLFGVLPVSGCIAIKYWRHINFKIVAVPLCLGLLGNYIGLTMLLRIDNTIAVKIIGVLMILLAVYFYIAKDKIRIPQNIWTASLAGIGAGLMGGFFNISGPPLVLYFCAAAKDKDEYTGTVQFLFLVLIAFKLVYLTAVRGLPAVVSVRIPMVLIGSTAGLFAGQRLFKRLSINTVKRLIYALMILSGLWYLIQ